MLQKTYKFFNQSTRQAFFERVKGYVAKSYEGEEEKGFEKELKRLYRFDLGENVIGYSPILYKFLQRFKGASAKEMQLNNYPEVLHQRIRRRIAETHHVDPNWVVLSTGLDAILDLISRVFFDPKDYYISLVPSFYLFEEYSERLGALPIFLELEEEDNFELTREKVEELKDQIIKFKPKVVWIANPNNPTGKVIDVETLEEIVKVAMYNNSFVVIDEAYIEFLSNTETHSAMQLVRKYNNLMVLRTFSKAHGLAGTRVGYLISSSTDIVEAMLMLRTHFPVTQLALNMASLALSDTQFLKQTRKQTKILGQELYQNLSTLNSFKFIESDTNVFLLKNTYLSDKELDEKLMEHGIATSFVNVPTHNENQYRRITIRDKKDNEYFYEACKQIDKEVVIDINTYYKKKFKHLPLYNTEYINKRQKTIALG